MSAYRLVHCVDAAPLAARFDEMAADHSEFPTYADLYAESAERVRADGSFERVKATFSWREAADAMAERMNAGVMPGVSYRVEEVVEEPAVPDVGRTGPLTPTPCASPVRRVSVAARPGRSTPERKDNTMTMTPSGPVYACGEYTSDGTLIRADRRYPVREETPQQVAETVLAGQGCPASVVLVWDDMNYVPPACMDDAVPTQGHATR